MPGRSRKEAKKYKRHLRKLPAGVCQFCEITSSSEQFVAETKTFKIIRNIFPYSYWDLQLVEDHLMIIPKKHSDNISELNAREAVEFMGLIGSYENQGYNVYMRAPASGIKSVEHQHTHLIKPIQSSLRRLVIFSEKPYFRFTR